MTPILWNKTMFIEQMQCGARIAHFLPENINLYRFWNIKLNDFARNARCDICGPYVRRSNASSLISFHHVDNLHYRRSLRGWGRDSGGKSILVKIISKCKCRRWCNTTLQLQSHPLTQFCQAFLFTSSKCSVILGPLLLIQVTAFVTTTGK